MTSRLSRTGCFTTSSISPSDPCASSRRLCAWTAPASRPLRPRPRSAPKPARSCAGSGSRRPRSTGFLRRGSRAPGLPSGRTERLSARRAPGEQVSSSPGGGRPLDGPALAPGCDGSAAGAGHFPSRGAVEAARLFQLVLLPQPCDLVADQSLRNRWNDLPGQGADRLVGVSGDPLADRGTDAFGLLLRCGVGGAAGFREDLPLDLAEELVDRGGGAREALDLLADEALDERGHDLPGERRHRLFHAAPAFAEDLLLELREELVDRGGGAREALELLADEALGERGHDLPGERGDRLLHASPALAGQLLAERRQERVERGGRVRG